MAVISVILFIVAYQKGSGGHIEGLESAADLLIQIIPLLIFAFLIAGLIQVLLPTKVVSKWLGTESGFRGVLIGTIVGGFMPGGPMVNLPVAAGLIRAGAGVGTMVAFLTGWSLWAISRMPIEIGLLGWKFTAVRFAVSVFLPLIAGTLANIFFSRVKLFIKMEGNN
jgi:uncharacterized membrane protein YraQ (UPF0718 family)